MRIHVKLFAILRDRAGVSELELELPAGSTVDRAADALVERFPQIQSYLPRVAHAVNQTYVKAGAPLRDGDELALIPPVSGGRE